jgi:hypothetical protein
MITTIKIFPSIGVARLGNSQDAYFIGPETPGDPVVPPGGFRDGASRIKRQAARFRLFAFDEADQLVSEVTTADGATINWTVHLANTKAAGEMFAGKATPPPGPRNATFADRGQLALDPGPAHVSGANADFADLTQSRVMGRATDIKVNQQFLDRPVAFLLGTVTTDDRGRLLVLGGLGESKSPVGADLSQGDFADHDGWYDDVSDGPVSADVVLADGSTPPVVGAWVLVAPPKYAPAFHSPVTLYDTLLQRAVDTGMVPSPVADAAFKPSMTHDILPILMRAANMRWVYDNGKTTFNPITGFHHTFSQMPPAARATVFAKLSVPSATAGNPGTGGGNMPRMWSDLYPDGSNGTLTRIQYEMLRRWKDGQFTADGPAPAGPITPEGLTRAALEPCVGGAFFPGIEISWKVRQFPLIEPFRFDASQMKPGDATAQMSLPWQSDFLDCAVEPGNGSVDLVWWPAQRPLAVLRNGGTQYVQWARSDQAETSPEMTPEQMVSAWMNLGFVLLQTNGRFEEVERL